MNKLWIITILMAMMMLSVVSAVSEYGIYTENVDFDFVTNATESAVTYLRDNYYGVAYIDDSGDGHLRVIETAGSFIINNSVDEWDFATGVSNLDLMSFNNETGLSVISYLSSSEGKYKSFDVYANGTINPRSSTSETSNTYTLLKTIKTSNTTFMTTIVSNNWASTINIYNTGYTIGPTGIMTESIGNKFYKYTDTTTGISYMDMQKIGGTCYIFFRENGKGRYDTLSCNNLEWSGGGAAVPSTISFSTFEANEIYDIDTSYDEDGGFIYLTYGETLDKYPVIAVRNATSFSLLDKERLFEETTTYNKIYTLSQQYLLNMYVKDSALYATSYTVANDGTLTNEYNESIYVNSGFSDLTAMPTTTDNFLLSHEDYDDISLRTLGIGLIPPPGPEDTTVTIKDENTLGAFNQTDLTLTFNAYCTNNTAYQSEITSETESIAVDCNYTGFGIEVEYELSNVTYSYTRYYLRDLDDTYGQFDLNVYLVNPYDTDFVTTNVIINDLRNTYENAEVFFEKNIDGVTTQITAFDLDLQDSIKAVLMTDEIYYVYIKSDETGKVFLGKYLSASAGTLEDYKVFNLFDIQMGPNYLNLDQKFDYKIYTEDYQVEYNAKTVSTLQPNLINLTIKIYNGTSSDDTLIYNDTLGGEYDPDNLYPLLSGNENLSAYENDSVYAEMTIWFSESSTPYQKPYNTQLWYGNEKIKLPLTDYVDQSFLDWFILILLSIVALYATIETANMASLAIIGMAALFVVFGWFGVGTGTLALAALISLVSLLAKKGGNPQ